MGVVNKDSGVPGASLVLSIVSLVLLFGVTWYFEASLDLLQQQVAYDRKLLLKLQVSYLIVSNNYNNDLVARVWVIRTC